MHTSKPTLEGYCSFTFTVLWLATDNSMTANSIQQVWMIPCLDLENTHGWQHWARMKMAGSTTDA